MTDASDFTGSSILFQSLLGGMDHVLKALRNNKSSWKTIEQLIKEISCYSHKFNETEKHYSAFDKELLTIILALEHNSYFLKNLNNSIYIITDNEPSAAILNGQNQKVVDNRRLRYLERLSPYNIRANHLKGTFKL